MVCHIQAYRAQEGLLYNLLRTGLWSPRGPITWSITYRPIEPEACKAKGSLERTKAGGSSEEGKATPQVSQDQWEVVAIIPTR